MIHWTLKYIRYKKNHRFAKLVSNCVSLSQHAHRLAQQTQEPCDMKLGQRDAIIHEIYFCLYQGRDIMQPRGSIPPDNLITKHEDATRKCVCVGGGVKMH